MSDKQRTLAKEVSLTGKGLHSGIDVNVITSYSIHYTKLYEAGSCFSGSFSGTASRITSYNVCYTKLLR